MALTLRHRSTTVRGTGRRMRSRPGTRGQLSGFTYPRSAGRWQLRQGVELLAISPGSQWPQRAAVMVASTGEVLACVHSQAVETATHATVLLDHIRESLGVGCATAPRDGRGTSRTGDGGRPRPPGQTPRTSCALLSGRPQVRVLSRARERAGEVGCCAHTLLLCDLTLCELDAFLDRSGHAPPADAGRPDRLHDRPDPGPGRCVGEGASRPRRVT